MQRMLQNEKYMGDASCKRLIR
ncbi:hypothetical protein ACVRY0_02110 [Streptococcus intermedius]